MRNTSSGKRSEHTSGGQISECMSGHKNNELNYEACE